MTHEQIVQAVDEAIRAAVRAAKAAIDAGACQTDTDFAKAREAREKSEDARDAAVAAIRAMSTHDISDISEREYNARADRASKGTEALASDEREAVLGLRFRKASEDFRTNPSAGNWGLLLDAMCAYQRRQ